jgi:NTP pyrophosphatase (non-canonical NTP hydrolase)
VAPASLIAPEQAGAGPGDGKGITVWDQVERLYNYHGDVPVEARLLKLTEEVGEVAEAYIGLQGMNKRKGICRTEEDLLDELADVIITAAVAMSGVTGDAKRAHSHLERRITTVTTRAGIAPAVEATGRGASV